MMKAVKATVNYTIQKTKIGLVYERVDPNYKTLGALFFANDLENIGFTLSRPFLKQKLIFNSNIGFQRDDLAAQKILVIFQKPAQLPKKYKLLKMVVLLL